MTLPRIARIPQILANNLIRENSCYSWLKDFIRVIRGGDYFQSNSKISKYFFQAFTFCLQGKNIKVILQAEFQ
jgi:hypothetical protein